MVKIASKIEKLIRTNTALVFLCVISIGVLILLVQDSENNNLPTKEISVDSTKINDSAQALELSPLKNMPDPSKFGSFTYKIDESVTVSSKCEDVYYVTIIYPMDVDYRTDLLSAKYNSAVQCIKGKSYNDILDLSGKGLIEGAKYYVVHASQAKKGSWYGPY